MVQPLLNLFKAKFHAIDHFRQTVEGFFRDNPDFIIDGRCVIHSVKSRTKNIDHLKDKISRKISEGRIINSTNFFDEITDLAGVRVLLLFQDDFKIINSVLREKIEVDKDWRFAEEPMAYTWDPESIEFFQNLGIQPKMKESAYTSVHYLVRPHNDNPLRCEIQVRTLFEEIWGEVDHHLNYPDPTSSIALKEQIRVLSKIVGAGSRLLDAINRVNDSIETK